MEALFLKRSGQLNSVFANVFDIRLYPFEVARIGVKTERKNSVVRRCFPARVLPECLFRSFSASDRSAPARPEAKL